MVSLSAEGCALVEHLKASRGEWFRLMLRDWESADAEVFSSYLERFAASFEMSKTASFEMPKTSPFEATKVMPSEAHKITLIEDSK